MITLIIRGFRRSIRHLDKKDYYKVLGLTQQATESEIKRAYFTLAKQFHPDINKDSDAKSKFAEISEAYETIANPEKRKFYNTSRKTSNSSEKAGSKYDPFEEFQKIRYTDFKDIFSEFEQTLGSTINQKISFKGDDVKVVVEIPFLEAVHGTSRTVKYDRKSACNTCHGTKIRPGTGHSKCSFCNGRGVVTYVKNDMSIQVICQKCKGHGLISNSTCGTCVGKGFLNTKINDVVHIPSGVDDGHTLKFVNKGSFSQNGGPPGDLQVRIIIIPDPQYRREGYDVHTDYNLSVPQAALGADLSIETIYGKKQVKIQAGTNPGDKFRIVNHGISYLPPSSLKGHHFVNFNIKIPKTLSDDEREIYEKLAKIKPKE